MSPRSHRPARSAHPTPAAGSSPNLAQLERVLTTVRDELLERHPPPAAVGPRLLRCTACGRTDPVTPDQLRDLARYGWPECCGRVMALAAEPPTGQAPGRERRGGDRRPARPGVRAEVRRGCLGMGPDLGLVLSDVSAEGLRLRLRGPVRAGEEAEVTLHPPDVEAVIRTRGRIIWCRPAGGWAFLAGVRLRRRLTADDLSVLMG